MKIKNTGSNTTEVHLQGLILLISYETPVAWYDDTCNVCWVTEKKWSRTTSRHINKFVKQCGGEGLVMEAPQEDLDLLYKNIREGLTPKEFMLQTIPVNSREEDLIIG